MTLEQRGGDITFVSVDIVFFYNQYCQPLSLTAVSSTATHLGVAVDGSVTLSVSIHTHQKLFEASVQRRVDQESLLFLRVID